MKIIDSHAHLEEIEDLEGALKRARQAGVAAIVAVGADRESNEKVLKICRLFKNPGIYPVIYPAVGIHPGNLEPSEFSSTFKLIEDNIEKVVAIGEMGLDYWYKEARREGPGRRLQEEIFLRQLDIANRCHKPIIIHSRGAWSDCFQKVAQRGIESAVFHWYSGPVEILEEILKKGYFISATPSAEYSKEHQQAITRAPLGSMLIETDSPVTYKPESGTYESEPKDVLRTLKAVAKIKNVEEARVAQKTTENAIRFFGK